MQTGPALQSHMILVNAGPIFVAHLAITDSHTTGIHWAIVWYVYVYVSMNFVDSWPNSCVIIRC